MAKEFDDEDDDFEVDESLQDIDDNLSTINSTSDARRRLEKLKEEKELERLINGKLDDLDF